MRLDRGSTKVLKSLFNSLAFLCRGLTGQCGRVFCDVPCRFYIFSVMCRDGGQFHLCYVKY